MIAPGAYFCLVGRPMLYAASIGGLACVLHAIRLLREEIDRDMALIGVRRMAELEPSPLRKMSQTIGSETMSHGTNETSLNLMCALAIRAPFDAVIVPDFQAAGHAVSIAWQPTTVIMKNIAVGQEADAVFVIDTAMDELIQQGVVDPETRTEVVVSRLGLGVRAGVPHPDISTQEAFRQALRNARSVAFSNAGASGIYFRGLIERMGIAEEVTAKATIIPAGFTAEKLVTGEADLAVQQISELLVVPGVEVIGPFPDAYQSTSAFSAAVFKASSNRELALAFLRSVRSPQAVAAYQRLGLELAKTR